MEPEAGQPGMINVKPSDDGVFRFRIKKTTPPPFPGFMIPPPAQDPKRKPGDVVKESAARDPNSRWGAMFDDSLRKMDERRLQAMDMQRRTQANLFLNSILFPALQGYSEATGYPQVPVLNDWINRNITISTLLMTDRDKVEGFVSNPRVLAFRPLISRAIKDMKEEDVKKPEVINWWIERINDSRPDLVAVIRQHPQGKVWVESTLIDLFRFLRGRAG